MINNENIMKYNHEKIASMKNNMLQKLQLPPNEIKNLHKKLKQYRYIDDLTDINYGSFIRWISLNDPTNIKFNKWRDNLRY